jgi:adenine-specific DNA-methyltransferase
VSTRLIFSLIDKSRVFGYSGQMNYTKNYRERFFEALAAVFCGADVQGEGGFVNLLKIKSKYYREVVLPKFMQEWQNDPMIRGDLNFEEDFFRYLWTFFEKYFSESGSVYFAKTGDRLYERVYQGDSDVALFWKTHMLYYVKSDVLFQDMELRVDETNFFFDVSGLEDKQNTEKRDLLFEYRGFRTQETGVELSHIKGTKTQRASGAGAHTFAVAYSVGGVKSDTGELARQARVDEKTLEKAFATFKKQVRVDFFINKDAGAFLREELDLILFLRLFNDKNVFQQKRLDQLKRIKEYALKIIDFVAQFEAELVRIWNKPKFARASGYVVTLDLLSEGLVEKLRQHPGWQAQEAEWRELGMVDDGALIPQDGLPLDTKHFKDLELAILGEFPDLDAALDGVLIHSDNYQALNTLAKRYGGKIKTIYIDPPYNTAASEIDYVNDYKHASWLSLMENRLELARDLLDKDTGVLCCLIDDVEQKNLGLLLEEKFGEVSGTVCIRIKPSGRPIPNGFATSHEYALFAKANPEYPIARLEHSEEQAARYGEHDDKGSFLWEYLRKSGSKPNRADRPLMYYPFYFDTRTEQLRIPDLEWDEENREYNILEEPTSDEKVVYPKLDDGSDGHWYLGVERARDLVSEFKAVFDKNGLYRIYYRRRQNEGAQPTTMWFDSKYSATEHGTALLKDLFGERETFSYPKSIYAVEDCLRVTDMNGESDVLVLDFFAGSGTTGHAVINLNRETSCLGALCAKQTQRRKYILVEMGAHFDTVLVPRIKKAAYSDKWKEGRAQPGGRAISQFFKYYSLEQYEDVLRRCSYNPDTPHQSYAEHAEEFFRDYIFRSDKKFADVLDADTLTLDFDKLYPDIDFAETIANLLGLPIKRITGDAVVLKDGAGERVVRTDWQALRGETAVEWVRLLRPLLWWGDE